MRLINHAVNGRCRLPVSDPSMQSTLTGCWKTRIRPSGKARGDATSAAQAYVSIGESRETLNGGFGRSFSTACKTFLCRRSDSIHGIKKMKRRCYLWYWHNKNIWYSKAFRLGFFLLQGPRTNGFCGMGIHSYQPIGVNLFAVVNFKLLYFNRYNTTRRFLWTRK